MSPGSLRRWALPAALLLLVALQTALLVRRGGQIPVIHLVAPPLTILETQDAVWLGQPPAPPEPSREHGPPPDDRLRREVVDGAIRMADLLTPTQQAAIVEQRGPLAERHGELKVWSDLAARLSR